MALRSRELWVEILESAQLSYRATGSLHLAYRDDEADVLREFAEIGPPAGYKCQWQSARQVLERSAAVRQDGLKGGLWSALEITVDPRLIVSRLPGYLRGLGVSIHFETAVHAIHLPRVETSRGPHEADVALVCSGDDFETLFPSVFRASGLNRCKLQMMRTATQSDGWQLGPALAAGLTLRFYKAFLICSTLGKLKERIASEKPDYERYLIHVLVSQTADGGITIGDSHEYGQCVSVFNKTAIDDLILDEARTFLELPDFRIAERWQGVYSTHPEKACFEAEPAPGVRIITGLGGSGMTLSFGLAERTLNRMGL